LIRALTIRIPNLLDRKVFDQLSINQKGETIEAVLPVANHFDSNIKINDIMGGELGVRALKGAR
jgi:hypothetical protein